MHRNTGDGVCAGGGGGTSEFVRELFTAIPPLSQLFKSVGLELPFGLAKTLETQKKTETLTADAEGGTASPQ